MTEDDIEQLINLIRLHAGEAPRHPPDKIVPRLAARLRAGKAVPGKRALAQIIGDEVVEKALEWLDLRQSRVKTNYEYRDAGTFYVSSNTKGERQELRLANFVAEIVEVVERDDGSGTLERTFKVESGIDSAEVPADEFDAMNWVTTAWGPAKSVAPGRDTKGHLAEAIKQNSPEIGHLRIRTHTGWIKSEGERVYLHAGGAIGKSGPVEGFTVELSGRLKHFVLPEPRDPIAAIQASLGMLKLGPIGVLMLAAVYRAPLAEFLEINTSVFVEGMTGTFKSAIQGIALSHWGPYWDGVQFPANWTGTANSLEKIAFSLKDVLIVVDDFKPSGPVGEVARLHQTAERLLRAAANHGGRTRMKADSTLRPEYYPRGLVMSSGEDIPKGHSLRARMVIQNVERHQVDLAALSQLQLHASRGLLAEGMAAYIQWTAGKAAPGFSEELAKNFQRLRSEVTGDHARTPSNIASLLIGIEYFTQFAVDFGALSEAEAIQLRTRAKDTIGLQATIQDAEQASEDPIQRFTLLLSEALAAGRVHLAAKSGGPPPGRKSSCGWRERRYKDAMDWQALGDQIGWIDDEIIWIRPNLAYAAVERLSRDQNRSLGVTQDTLFKRLRAAGMVERSTTIRAAGGAGAVSRVYPIKAGLVLPPADAMSQVQRLNVLLDATVAMEPLAEGELAGTLKKVIYLTGEELKKLVPGTKGAPM